MEKVGCCSQPEDLNGGGGKKEAVWSEAAVWTLVNAYEDKWRQVEWGSLKARHWEEVAAALSAAHWPPKSPAQCKNKIEDLKKKFKEKIQRGGGSSSSSKWPYFARMEAMFKNAARGGGATSSIEGAVCLSAFPDRPHAIFSHHLRFGGAPAHGFLDEMNEREFEDDRNESDEHGEDDEGGGLDEEDDEEEQELCFDPSVVGSKRKAQQQQQQQHRIEEMTGKSSRKRLDSCSMKDALVTLVSSLGESVVRIERAKLEGQRQLMMMRAQAENRRIEMETKTYEMFNSIQLQLAELISQTSGSTNQTKT